MSMLHFHYNLLLLNNMEDHNIQMHYLEQYNLENGYLGMIYFVFLAYQ